MDALRRQLARHALREAAQREFAHREGRGQRISLDARRGAGEEHRTMTLWKHAGDRLARHQEPAIGADHERSLDLGRNQFGDRAAGAGAGIVDDDIGRAGRASTAVNMLRHLVRVGGVAGESLCAGLGAERRRAFRSRAQQVPPAAPRAQNRRAKTRSDPARRRRSARSDSSALACGSPRWLPSGDNLTQYPAPEGDDDAASPRTAPKEIRRGPRQADGLCRAWPRRARVSFPARQPDLVLPVAQCHVGGRRSRPLCRARSDRDG